ncbi:MAG: hypothetical protein LBT38_01330 [Deltaproteobacteria bacterium]|nr:hypothetical protein [Deltaproteobacteria bacterium]
MVNLTLPGKMSLFKIFRYSGRGKGLTLLKGGLWAPRGITEIRSPSLMSGEERADRSQKTSLSK